MDSETPTQRAPRAKRTAGATTDTSPAKRKRAPKLQVVRDVEPSKAVELKKATEALSMRNVSAASDFTFLQRKLYNTLLQFAQQRPREEMVHEISIKQVEDNIGHTTSNSRDYLKKVLVSMSQTQVEFDYKGESPGRKSEWGIANLIAEAYILEDGQTLRFSFPPDLKRRLLDPAIFNLIDLRMQYHFSSFSALTLHEITSRYLGSPMGETYRAHWSEWSVVLSGSATPHAEFRDFNKMLGRAIDQVNSIERRFRITPHVTKLNRKMDKLWFKLETLIQPGLDLGPSPELVSQDVSKRLKALSLSQKDIDELGMTHDEEYLLAQADYTEAQMRKEGANVASPAAYFKAAVANNYAKAPTQQKAAEPGRGKKPAASKTGEKSKPAQAPSQAPKAAPSNQMADLLEQWGAAQREAIRAQFMELSDEQKKELAAKYETELRKDELAYSQYRSKGLNTMVINCLVAIQFQERFPETPNPETLLQFLLGGAKI